MKPGPAISARSISSLGRQRVEDRLRQLPRVAARRFRQLQRDVRGEIAVRGVARALDVDDGADDVGGQDVGRQGGERGLDELFDPIFHVRRRR